MFCIFTSALVQTVLVVSLIITKCLLQNLYVSVFIIKFLFKIITTALLLTAQSYLDAVSLYLSIIRTIVALTLLIISNLSYTVEMHLEEEAQPLLRYSNINITLQRQPIELRNQIKYLQSFVIFMPHLLLWHNLKILSYLAICLIIALLNCVLNIVIPQLYSTILNKLILGLGTLLRKVIIIQIISLLINFYSRLDVLD